MKVTLPDKVTGARDALFVLEVEFPVAATERKVEVAASGPVEPLDLSGSSRGGTYRIPVGLERLHVPMRVLEDGDGEARVTVTCLEGPEATLTDHQSLKLEAPGAAPARGGSKRLLLGALALGAVAVLAYLLAGRGDDEKVPDVRGQAEGAARVALKEAGYAVRPTYDREADVADDGRVIRQIPDAGTKAPSARIVEIVIGRVPQQVPPVPSVQGDTVENAERTLDGLGYQVIVTEQDNDDPLMTGRVLAQVPEGGERVEPGSPVEIVVARAPAFVAMPDLLGVARAEAERRLEALGLVPEVELEDTSEVRQDGAVIRQAPEAATRLDVGSIVGLVVGRGMAAETVPEEEWSEPVVPAQPELATDEPPLPTPAPETPYNPEATTPEPLVADPAGTSLPADPLAPVPEAGVEPAEAVAGHALERDAQGQVVIPDFTGWGREEAIERLREAGLQPIVTLTPVADGAQRARVIRQRPAPGSRRAGGMVFLTVGEGAPEEAVPELPTTPSAIDAPQDPLAPEGVAEVETPVEPGMGGDEVVPGPTAPEAGTTEPAAPVTVDTTSTSMPDVVGLQEAQAEARLVEAGWVVEVFRQPTDYPPAGTVLAQDPPPGKPLARGARVRLEVAVAPGTPLPESTAPEVTAPTPVEAPEDVPSTAPAPGVGPSALPDDVVRVPAGPGPRGPLPPVRLPPRDAPKTATVPATRDAPVQDAVIRVLRAGLIPIIEMDRSGRGRDGLVLSQVPAASTPALPGDLVRLRVAAPPRGGERMVDLPTVIGADLDSARRIFAGTRTGIEVYEIRVPGHPYAGTRRVAAQYPVSSMPRAQAGRVTLFVVER